MTSACCTEGGVASLFTPHRHTTAPAGPGGAWDGAAAALTRPHLEQTPPRLPQTEHAAGGSGRRRGLTLAVVCTAIFMLVLDVTIVSVALADLQRDLSAGFDDLQWVVDAYTLTLAGGLLTAATLGDRIGRRRVFAAGLAWFCLASLACALATTVVQLNAARAAQGLGAALLFGTALPLLGVAFPEGRGRARAVGAFGASMSAATAVGPLVGGALVDGPGWRWIFLINVPVGATALVATLGLVESRPRTARRADWPGAALLTAGLLCLLLALIRGNSSGWVSPPIVGLFLAAALIGVAFAAREATASEPMLDLDLLARPAFAGAALQAFALGTSLIAATYYLALYLQNTLGFSPLGTGLRVLPLTVAAFAAALLTAALLRRTGASLPLALALFVGADGLALAAWGAFLLAGDPGRSWTVLVPGFVLAGTGLGAGLASSASAALAAVEPERAGMATGTITTVRQVGVAAGVAALGALFQHRAGQGSTDALALVLLAAATTALLSGLACIVLLGLLRGQRR
jgi:EmrB/QacA subfamily drug resistance transporter